MRTLAKFYNHATIYVSVRLRWMVVNLFNVLWELPILQKPHMIVSLFYTLLPLALMYLYFEFDGEFGLRQLESLTNVNWVVWVLMFSATGWIVAYSKRAYIYALGVTPSIIYLVAIVGSLERVGILGILPVIYLSMFALAYLSAVKTRFNLNRLIKEIDVLRGKIQYAFTLIATTTARTKRLIAHVNALNTYSTRLEAFIVDNDLSVPDNVLKPEISEDELKPIKISKQLKEGTNG